METASKRLLWIWSWPWTSLCCTSKGSHELTANKLGKCRSSSGVVGVTIDVFLVTGDGAMPEGITTNMSVYCVKMLYSSLLVLEQVFWLAVTKARGGSSLRASEVTSS